MPFVFIKIKMLPLFIIMYYDDNVYICNLLDLKHLAGIAALNTIILC